MGTRHLTVVKTDGEYKIAQYGQWDGYPEGAGTAVLDFAHKIADPYTRNQFRENVRKLRFITEEEAKKFREYIKKHSDWDKNYPQFTRDTGTDILDLVMNGKVAVVHDMFDFAFDHSDCEYIWGIDLDAGVFGLYFGDDKTRTLIPEVVFLLDDLPPKKDFLDAFREE